MTLGLADSSAGHLDVYVDQLLLLFTVLGACHVAPIWTKCSVAPFSAEKRNDFSTLCLSAQKVLQMAPGVSQVLPEPPPEPPSGCPEVPSRLPFPRFLLQDSSSRTRPLGFLLKHSSSRIPLSGFLLSQDSFCGIPASGFLFHDSASRLPLSGFLLSQDSFCRIPPPGLLL